jgi:ATP-dependent protease ClpP protease subunit
MKRLRIDSALLAQVHALLARRDERPLPKGFTRPELKFTAQADGQPAELLIYDEISWWGIMAVDVAAALTTLSGPLHVRINSPGGDVFDGVAIYNMLADYGDEVTVTVDGLAASAASFIAMAGDTIRMNRASQMMIHDASGMCRGNAADMKAMAALLDVVSGTIADIYAARAGGDAADWRERMLVDGGFGTWYTAEDAVASGLADELVPNSGRQEGDDEQDAMDRLAAALFPYGVDDERGRWRLAATLSPQSGDPVVVQHERAHHQPVPLVDLDALRAAVQERAPTPNAGPHPAAAVPQPPPGQPTESAPAPPIEPPAPAPAAAADETAPDWGDLVTHLTTPAEPSADDLLASLREAQ